MLHELNGDLIELALEGRFDAIVHGCNCFCTMGAGLAARVRSEFPEAFAADRATVKGDRAKLGRYSSAYSRDMLVINACTQYDFRGRGVKADYGAIRECMERIDANFASLRIGLPQIGAGLAGGDWRIIHAILEEAFRNTDAAAVYWQPRR